MYYTLTKYLSSDYFRENEFTKAFLELVDEIIFCCYMESREILSQLSFEQMDDNYFLTFQEFFLNGLSNFDINKLDKNVLSEWFSLLHVRGELSDLSKLFNFGGSLTKVDVKNKIQLYHNADVPESITKIGVDGIIYAITEENINISEDYLIEQQIPAGYRFGLIKQTPPDYIHSVTSVDLNLIKQNEYIVIDVGSIDVEKEKFSDIEFYRRRQFDNTYTFAQLYKSGYTVNELSSTHIDGTFYFGFDIEIVESEPVVIESEKDIFVGVASCPFSFIIADGSMEILNNDFIISGTFSDETSYVTLKNIDSIEDVYIDYISTERNNYSINTGMEQHPDSGVLEYETTERNNYIIDDVYPTIPPGGTFVNSIAIDGLNVDFWFIPQVEVFDVYYEEPIYINNKLVIHGGQYESQECLIDIPIVGGQYECTPVTISTEIQGGSYVSETTIIDTEISGGNYESESVLINTNINGGSYQSEETVIDTTINGGNYESNPVVMDTKIYGGNYESDPTIIDLVISGGEYESQPTVIDTQIQGGEYESQPTTIDTQIHGGQYESNSVLIDTSITGGNYESSSVVLDTQIRGGSYESNSVLIDSSITGGTYESQSTLIDYSITGGEYESSSVVIDISINGGEYESSSVEIDTNLPVINSYSDSSVSPLSVSPDSDFDTGLEYSVNTLYSVQTDDGQGNITRSGWEVEPTILPTISVGGDFGTKNWLWRTNGGTVMSIDANSQEDLWYPGSGGYVNIPYDTSKAYAVLLWYYDTGSSDIGQNGVLSIANNLGQIAARNNTSSYVNLYALRCAVCSSNQATVVTVYNSSNVAYNAFKFTANNTDYYYVLDGTQTDWTDDLESIGYSLTPVVFRAWFNPDKSYRIAVTNGWSGMLYGNDGNYAPYDNTKTYVIHSVINNSGSPISVNVSQLALSQDGGAYMRFANNSGTTLYNVVYIEYTVS